MDKKLKISLIIAVYKRTDFLELVLISLGRQTYADFEVIIAEDDSSEEMKEFIETQQSQYKFDIRHLSQEDRGFRKNKILNEAVRCARGEYLVFIDGDCILHKNFLKEYAKRAEPGVCLFGRRVMLDPVTTKNLIETKKYSMLSFFRLFFNRARKIEDALYLPFLSQVSRRIRKIVGCNFCVPRAKMVEINGFDEDFERPLYGEDTDVWRRLVLAGVKMRSTKFITIQYHLHHSVKGRTADWEHSGKLYRKKTEEGLVFCRNGLIKQG